MNPDAYAALVAFSAAKRRLAKARLVFDEAAREVRAAQRDMQLAGDALVGHVDPSFAPAGGGQLALPTPTGGPASALDPDPDPRPWSRARPRTPEHS